MRLSEFWGVKYPEHGIMNGANHPGDIPLGELAVIFANTDRVFEVAETEE